MTSPVVQVSRIGDLEIAWDERILRPRPWTRHQADWAVELACDLPDGPLVELFTGAGHIGLLAAQRSGRLAVLVDADPVACGFAERNAADAGLAQRVEVHCERVTGASLHCVDDSVPLVLADPPYLPSAVVGRFSDDPVHAIDGGADGLELVAAAVGTVARHLAVGGSCLVQLAGGEQAAVVAAMLDGPWVTAGLELVEVREFGSDRSVARLDRRHGQVRRSAEAGTPAPC